MLVRIFKRLCRDREGFDGSEVVRRIPLRTFLKSPLTCFDVVYSRYFPFVSIIGGGCELKLTEEKPDYSVPRRF